MKDVTPLSQLTFPMLVGEWWLRKHKPRHCIAPRGSYNPLHMSGPTGLAVVSSPFAQEVEEGAPTSVAR